jgi:hypothetical protein
VGHDQHSASPELVQRPQVPCREPDITARLSVSGMRNQALHSRQFEGEAVGVAALALDRGTSLCCATCMSTEETATHLDIRIETVRTRLHRARKLMRAAIERQLSGAFSALFPFDAARCTSMAEQVILALQSRTKA